MSAGSLGLRRAPSSAADVRVAAVCACLIGVGTAGVLAGTASGSDTLLLGAAGAACAGLLVALAAGWADGLAVVALSLPLPALYATEGLRLATAAPVTALVVAGWVLLRGADRAPVSLGALPRRTGAAFALAVLLSAAFARHPLDAAREVVNLTAMALLLVAAVDALSGRPDRIRRLARVLGVVVGGAGGIAALQTVGVLPSRFPFAETGLRRAPGGFEWPNEMGIFLAVGIPFAVYVFRSAETTAGRLVAISGVSLAVLGLLGTFSRGSWLSALVAPGVLWLAGRRRLVAGIWCGALLAALLTNAGSGGAVVERITTSTVDQSAPQRLALMLTGVLMFLDRPFVGVGIGGFAGELESYGLLVPGLWNFVGSAHNAYIHIAAEAGLPGLVTFVAFVLLVGRALLRRARAPTPDDPLEPELRATLLWAWAAVLLVGMFEWTFAHGVGQLIVLVAAMGLADAAPRADGAPSGPFRAAAPGSAPGRPSGSGGHRAGGAGARPARPLGAPE